MLVLRLPMPQNSSAEMYAFMSQCWKADRRLRPDAYQVVSSMQEKLINNSVSLILTAMSVKQCSDYGQPRFRKINSLYRLYVKIMGHSKTVGNKKIYPRKLPSISM